MRFDVDPTDPAQLTDFVEVATDTYLFSPTTELTYKVGFKEVTGKPPGKKPSRRHP